MFGMLIPGFAVIFLGMRIEVVFNFIEAHKLTVALVFRGHSDPVLCMGVTHHLHYDAPNANVPVFASSSADGTVRLWDTSSFTCTHIFHSMPLKLDLTPQASMACIIQPPYLIACSDDGQISLHNICVSESEDDESSLSNTKEAKPGVPKSASKILEHDVCNKSISCRVERELEKALRAFVKIEYVNVYLIFL